MNRTDEIIDNLNHFNDPRVRAGRRGDWWHTMNPTTMQATVLIEDEDGVETEVSTAFEFEVCGLCQGRGSHVNPAIDSNGLTPEDFYEDPEFQEAYFSGAHDVGCASCKGKCVVPVATDEKVIAHLNEAAQCQSDFDAEREAEIRFGC